MRCPYCGNENPDDHRFCGMCGRAIPAPTAETTIPEPVRHREPATPAPAYTGGIFNLGASADRPQQSLDYLLDDDEEPKSHKGLVFLFVMALALAGGLGYLRWRNGSLPSLRSLTAAIKPAPATTSPDASANPAASDPSNSTATPPATAPSPGSGAPSSSSPTPPAEPTTSAAPPSSESAAPASANPPSPAANSSNPPDATDSTPSKESASSATPSPDAEKPTEPSAPAAPPPHAKPKPVAKPAPKPAAKPSDQVTLGEQYLYGRGVPQNCERGLHYVRPAAEQSNTKAMITMGALYATGHCINRDLPTAYRFFALALRTDPGNGPLRQNAEMVWKQMTAEERKQAIRLTQ